MGVRALWFIVFALPGFLAGPTLGGEREIISRIESFFAADEPDRRAQLAQAIEDDPDFNWNQVGRWLHQARLFESIPPGERKINIPLDHGEFRTVLVRTPKGYSPERPWPLIVMFHGSFADVGEDWSLRVVERMLGDRIDEFVVACPGNFGQDVIDTLDPPSVEHPAVLLALKKMLHIDSDRVFVFGISMGGYCCWTVATLHPDQFAGAIPMSATFSMPSYIDGLWASMLPNVRHLPVLQVWGAEDQNQTIQVHGVPADRSIAALNKRFMATTSELGLENIRFHEIPGRGHFPAFPTDEELGRMLEHRRVHSPADLRHRFRSIYQSPAYWLEGQTWIGARWRMDSLLFVTLGQEPPERRAAMGQWIHDRLGELRGEHRGQSFEIHRTHVGELTLWLNEGMVNWEQPIQVRLDDREVFHDLLEPDLLVCLTQARRTFDFDRLRRAGLRIDADGAATRVTGGTFFPPLMEVEAYSAGAGN